MTEKQQFFAQYWGQEVMPSKNGVWTCDPFYSSDDNYLLLTPLEQITDEHLLECAKVCGYLKNSTNDQFKINMMKSYFVGDELTGRMSIPSSTFWLPAFDFLRTLGYAFPWKHYTVDQLVQMGWVKLKQ